MEIHEALELTKSIGNRCAALIIIGQVASGLAPGLAEEITHTLIEDLYQDAQKLIEYSVSEK